MFSPSCWTGWQSSHRPLIFWSLYSLRLRCQMAVVFEEGVKKKEKKNRNRLGVVTSRREEWVRRRESVKVLRWRLEAGWHLQPLKAPLRNAVIIWRSRRWNVEIKEQKDIRKSLISHPFCPAACDFQYESGERTLLPISRFLLRRSKRDTRDWYQVWSAARF